MAGRAGDQRRLEVGLGQRRAVQLTDAHPLPFGQRQGDGHLAPSPAAALAPGDVRRNDALGLGRQLHLASPAFAGDPAVSFQVVRDGREDVGGRLPDVAAAVAVEVLGVFQVAGRHELRLAHRPCPRAAHVRQLDVRRDRGSRARLNSSLRKSVERRGSQASVASAADDRPDAGEPAEVRLDPPDGHDDLRRHRVALVDALQEIGVSGRHLPCRCGRLTRASAGRCRFRAAARFPPARDRARAPPAAARRPWRAPCRRCPRAARARSPRRAVRRAIRRTTAASVPAGRRGAGRRVLLVAWS